MGNIDHTKWYFVYWLEDTFPKYSFYVEKQYPYYYITIRKRKTINELYFIFAFILLFRKWYWK